MLHKDLRLTSCLHLQLSPPVRGAEVRKSDAPPSDCYAFWGGSGASQPILTLPGLYALVTRASRDSLITITMAWQVNPSRDLVTDIVLNHHDCC